MVQDKDNFILEVIDELPKKKMSRTSRVNIILQKLYDSTERGKIVKFDPKKASVNAYSLRYQLRQFLKAGLFAAGTKIVARNKEWYFIRGK